MDMTSDEIETFWKLGASLASAPAEARESFEFMQAATVYETLKEKMLSYMDDLSKSPNGKPEPMKLEEAISIVRTTLTELQRLEHAQFNQATPKEDIEKFKTKWTLVKTALETEEQAALASRQPQNFE